jgi:peptidoglycan hydrolase CwlO-like protein
MKNKMFLVIALLLAALLTCYVIMSIVFSASVNKLENLRSELSKNEKSISNSTSLNDVYNQEIKKIISSLEESNSRQAGNDKEDAIRKRLIAIEEKIKNKKELNEPERWFYETMSPIMDKRSEQLIRDEEFINRLKKMQK